MIKPNCLKVAKFVFILMVLPLSFVALNSFSKVYAQTSSSINFQGKIVRNDTGYEGLNVVDGSPACVVAGSDTCDFRVNYYSASTLGTLFFTETFADVEIGQYGGVFELNLGTGTGTAGIYSSLSETIQGENSVYVEILFSPAGDGTYTETFSRMPLRSSAFSFRSKFAEMATGAFLFENSVDSTGYTGSDGMVYYDTTNSQLMLYSGGSWQALATGGSSIWTGSSLTAFTHAQFLETSGIATLPNFGVDSTEDRAWIHGASSKTGLSVYSNFNAGTDWPLVSFKADASSYSGSILRLVQDGTGTLLEGYKGSNSVFRFDNSGNLHLESDGVMYFEKFASLPTGAQLSPLTGEGCMYTVGTNIYWDPACDGASPTSLNSGSSLWSDAGDFTFLSSTSDNLVLGGSTVADATFFFDVTGGSGNYFEVDNAGNTERLFTIGNTGNVGIGVLNPTSKLQVGGSSSTISNTTGNLSILGFADLIFSTGASERMRILSTGNVGVGTSTPTSLFSVGTTSGFQVDADGDILSIKGLSYLWPSAHTTNGVLTNNGSGTLSWSTIASLGGVSGTGSAGQVAFFNSGTSITGDNGFFWDNTNKRLGIGTTTPQSTIDIAGASSEIANSAGPISIIPANGNLRMIGPGTNYGGSEITFGDSDYVSVGEYGTGNSNLLSLNGISGVSFFTNNTERMRINNVGRVGIGTNYASPLAGLDVSFVNSAASDFIASRTNVTQSVAGALTAYGYRAIAEANHTTGTLTGLQANSTQINVTGSGGTVSYADGVTANASVSTGATISNLALMRVYAPSGAGTMQNVKGLQIGNINMGTSSNYSIYSEGGDMYHAGNIGIGKVPGYKLDVAGTVRADSFIGGSATGLVVHAAATGSTDGAFMEMYGSSHATRPGELGLGSTTANGIIRFWNYTSSYTELMRIDANGRVGIGRVADTLYKLDVAGTTRISSAIEVGTGATSNQTAYIDLVGDTSHPDYGLRIIRGNTGANTNSTIAHKGSGPLQFVTEDTGGSFTFYTQGSEKMRIAANGSVSIGSTTSDAKLRVVGATSTNIGYGTTNVAIFGQDISTTASSTIFGIDGNVRSLASQNTTGYRQAVHGALTDTAGTSWYAAGGLGVMQYLGGVHTVASVTGSIGTCPSGYTCYAAWLGGNVKVTTLGTGALYTNAGVLTNTNPSSMEYKHDIKEIDLQGERLLGINLKSFVWNSDGTYDYGLIAEEVQQIVPELYSYDSATNTKGYRLSHLPFYLLDLAQKQEKRIVSLESALGVESNNIQALITESGWYHILKTSSNESSNIRISNSSVGSNQNINMIVDKDNINIISNFTSGNSLIDKTRVYTVGNDTYVDVYITNANSNNISVSNDSNKWSIEPITKVNDFVAAQEYSLNGIQFGISDTFSTSKESTTTSGTLLTSGMYSDIGNSMNRWNDIYAKGAIRIGNGGDSEGGIRYNVEKKKLEFSNDGLAWMEVGDLTSSMVLSAEYSGAILYADGSENSGRMTSDAVETDGVFKNYYEWVSERDTLQDYDILVRITLPSDFVGWNQDAISLDIMTENSAMSTNNKVDISLLGKSGIDAQVVDGISMLPANWERISIKGVDIDSCNKANDTCTLKISMFSKDNYFVRVGDITLNYNRGL